MLVHVLDAQNNKLGSGPIQTAISWKSTAKMDGAGDWVLTVPADDPQTEEIERFRKVFAFTHDDVAGRQDLGGGVVKSIRRVDRGDGVVLLEVSGPDEMGELADVSVGQLDLTAGGAGVPFAVAVAMVESYAPNGWRFVVPSSAPSVNIYQRFNGESVLSVARAVAEKAGGHVRLNGAQRLEFVVEADDSGVRAVEPGHEAGRYEYICYLHGMEELEDSHDVITRCSPVGAGQGLVQLDLGASTDAVPSGFSVDRVNNVLVNETLEATLGRSIFRRLSFADVAPIENTDADLNTAANVLLSGAVNELVRRSVSPRTYAPGLVGCHKVVLPFQQITCDFRRVSANGRRLLWVHEKLIVLQSSVEVGADGLRTSSVVVSTVDRFPSDDTTAVVERLQEAHVFRSHPQLNANSYVTGYSKPMDAGNDAEFRFRFGAEVVQLQQVAFDFQVLALEANVKAVTGVQTVANTQTVSFSGQVSATATTGNISTNVSAQPSVNDTGVPSVLESGQAGAGSTGDAGAGSTGSAGAGSTGLAGDGVTGLSGGGDTSAAGGGNTSATTQSSTSATTQSNTGNSGQADTSATTQSSTSATTQSNTGNSGQVKTWTSGQLTAADSGEINTGNAGGGNTGNAGDGNTGNAGGGNTGNAGGGSTSDAGGGSTGNAGSGNTGNAGGGSTSDAGGGSTSQTSQVNTGFSATANTGQGGQSSTGQSAGATTGMGGSNTNHNDQDTTWNSVVLETSAVTGNTQSGGGGNTGSAGGSSGGPSNNQTSTPHGGDTSSNRHSHTWRLNDRGGWGGVPVYFKQLGGSGQLCADGYSWDISTNASGQHVHTADHTHDMGGHTHFIGAHSHTLQSHSHPLGQHYHVIRAHNHIVPQHSHTVTNHNHSIPGHSHTVTGHTHTIAGHRHTVAGHSHTLTAHRHTMQGHTHTVAGHSHTVMAHRHTLQGHSHTVTAHRHTLQGHTHKIQGHSHTVAGHTHTIAGHTHTMQGHTHTVAGHSHTVAGHKHTIAGHTHTVSGHSHTISSHDHRISNHTHSVSSHSHSMLAHNHSMQAHSHTLSNHTHSLQSHKHNIHHTHRIDHTHDIGHSHTIMHQHNFTPNVSMQYGLFRDVAANTLKVNELLYQVNSSSWKSLSAAVTSLSGGWYRLDLSSLVMASASFRPLQEDNILRLRTMKANKAAVVDGQLTVRNVIQAIVYS